MTQQTVEDAAPHAHSVRVAACPHGSVVLALYDEAEALMAVAQMPIGVAVDVLDDLGKQCEAAIDTLKALAAANNDGRKAP